MSDERRQHPRLPSRLSVRFASPKAFLQQYTENISKGGLLIRTGKPLPRGTDIEIVLHLPLTHREMQIKARVVHIPIGGDGLPIGMGVQFTDFIPEQREVIEAYVAMVSDKHAKGRI